MTKQSSTLRLITIHKADAVVGVDGALSFVGSWHETCRTAAPDLTDANRDALVGAMRRLGFQHLADAPVIVKQGGLQPARCLPKLVGCTWCRDRVEHTRRMLAVRRSSSASIATFVTSSPTASPTIASALATHARL